MTAAVGHPTLRLIRVVDRAVRARDAAAGQWRAEEPVRLR